MTTLPVSRGDVVESVGATGTLQAVTTVVVGSQVSGQIKALYADFNQIVNKGQIIAELDPSLLQTQIESNRANLVRSQADLDRLKVSLEDSRTKLKRSESLSARKLIAPQDLEAAQMAVRQAEAQVKSSEASLVQSQASLSQAEVNLQHTVIEAPITGIVIERAVDVGQTVAASMNAPTLFTIAADLSKMQVNASVDESDVARIRPGQVVRFRVDAYPDEFLGAISQVRLKPIVSQNVVTYATVIDVPNPQFKLKPGMTANVTIEIARRADVIRVPNAAIRFRPTNDIFAALNQPVPPEMQRGAGRGAGAGGGPAGSRGGDPAAGAAGGGPRGGAQAPGATPNANQAPGARGTAQPGAAPAAAPGGGGRGGDQAATAGAAGGGRGGTQAGGGQRGGGQNADPEARRQAMQERLAKMTPEERAQFEERMRARGMDPNNPTCGQGQGRGQGRAQGGEPQSGMRGGGQPGERVGSGFPGLDRANAAANPAAAKAGAPAQTIDQLFGPLPVTESQGRAWVYANGQIKSIRLRLGITDGTYTELLSGEIQAGQELVTAIVTPAMAAAARSPLMPQGGMPGMGGQRGGPGGGPGGGGGGRGR